MKSLRQIPPLTLTALVFLASLAMMSAADAPQKTLPLPGQVFQIEGRTACVILPATRGTKHPLPWVWYAPTLPGLPGTEERWMFERFIAAGICVQPIYRPARPTRVLRAISRVLHLLAFPLAVAFSADAAEITPVRVLGWDEQQPEQKRTYGEKFLCETITAHLAAQTGFTVRNVSLNSPARGPDAVTLDSTDVVFKQAEPLRVVENAARWLAQDTGAKNSVSAPAPPVVRFDPVLRDIEGWEVHVEPALLDGKHRDEGAKALAMLANHLQRIKILVPTEPLAKLQTIEIWIEHDHPRLKSMQYHPSRDWLLDHGHDPRLARKVHITQARQLLSRGQMLKHPAVVLHELAHGYHDQILSFDHPEIIAAYKMARESGSYTNVLLYTGQKVKHYGLTDHKEYFAEGTEAYLYRNDFYPFVRAELKEHDPTLHEALIKVWGPAN